MSDLQVATGTDPLEVAVAEASAVSQHAIYGGGQIPRNHTVVSERIGVAGRPGHGSRVGTSWTFEALLVSLHKIVGLWIYLLESLSTS